MDGGTMSLVEQGLTLGDVPRHRTEDNPKIRSEKVSFWYGHKQALIDVTLDIFDREVTALIGPSGCGKTTFLRCLNRMNDVIRGTRMEGRITLDGEDIHDPALDVTQLRMRFGWVAQKPNPFPWSIYANVAYGPRIKGLVANRRDADRIVEQALREADLWEEVKDRLDEPGTALSGGQQQRLCIARAIASRPEVLLMDEPCSALDPTATAHFEQLIDSLRQKYAIVIITHNLQQAARLAQRVAFFHLGRLHEYGDAADILINPQDPLCRDYVTGRYG